MKIIQVSQKGSDIQVQLAEPEKLPDFSEYIAQLYREVPGNEDITAGDISLFMVPELMNQGRRVYGIQKGNESNPEFQIWGDLSERKAYGIMRYSAQTEQQQSLYSMLESICQS